MKKRAPIDDDAIKAAADRAEPTPEKRGRGRPSIRTPELVDDFCQRVASGRSVSSVCADMDMPEPTTVYRWRQESPDFRDKLAHARDERLETYGDRMLALGARVIEEADLDPQRVNAAVNAIDKAARLQAPKQRIELTGKDGSAIQHDVSVSIDLSHASAEVLAALEADLLAKTGAGE